MAKELRNKKDNVIDLSKDDRAILIRAINSGIGNTELYKMMLELHLKVGNKYCLEKRKLKN